MKFLVAFAVLIVCAAAIPGDRDAQVVAQSQEINPDGSWKNELKLDNGVAQSQQGQLKQVQGAESPSISVQGSYIQIAEDGSPLEVRYIADENGFQPQGAHLPKSP